jgi:HEAT repeat protein
LPNEDATSDKIHVLIRELEGVDNEDRGRYSHEKHRRWEELFRQLRELPDATVDRMIQMLRDRDEYARSCAANVLGMAADKRAVDALVAALKDSQPMVRGCAALASGRTGDRRAVPSLIEAMKDEHHGVRRQVATALGQLADPRATRALITAIKKGDGRYCDVYTPMAIVAMWQAPVTHPGRYNEPASWALTEIGKPAVQDLLTALEDPEGENHAYIAWALGRIGGSAIEPLVVLSKHRDPKIRANAVIALGEAGGKQAVEVLVSARNDADERVRQLANEALEKFEAKRDTERDRR